MKASKQKLYLNSHAVAAHLSFHSVLWGPASVLQIIAITQAFNFIDALSW